MSETVPEFIARTMPKRDSYLRGLLMTSSNPVIVAVREHLIECGLWVPE